jgi:hypothetical protein
VGAPTNVGLALFAVLFLLAAAGHHRVGRLWGRSAVIGRIRLRRPPPPQPPGRPIEAIAADVRRLGQEFRYLPAGASFTRFEARRRAYDLALAEACRALDIAHLLEVLPPGADLDRERDRVELVLDYAGFQPNTLP